MIHRRTHPTYVEGCAPCRWASIGISAEATPTRKPRIAEVNAKQAEWDRDMPAYKAMRRQGIQPPSIDGAADLQARATDKCEIEMGKIIPFKDLRDAVTEGHVRSQEMGLIP